MQCNNFKDVTAFLGIEEEGYSFLTEPFQLDFVCHKIRLMPSEMAKLFALVLKEEEFKCAFERIVFAILDDHNSHSPMNPRGNYLPFKEMFG